MLLFIEWRITSREKSTFDLYLYYPLIQANLESFSNNSWSFWISFVWVWV